jgi:hypothetical protein
MTQPAKSEPARRTRSLRRDSSVASAEREIERVFGLPKGSVRLVNPNKRKARSDKSVGNLLADWGW